MYTYSYICFIVNICPKLPKLTQKLFKITHKLPNFVIFENLPILPCLSNEVAPPCDEELELLPVPPLPILLRRRQTQQQQISIETKPNNTPPAAAPIIMAKFESFRSFLPPGKPTWKYKCLIYSIENLVILILSP